MIEDIPLRMQLAAKGHNPDRLSVLAHRSSGKRVTVLLSNGLTVTGKHFCGGTNYDIPATSEN